LRDEGSKGLESLNTQPTPLNVFSPSTLNQEPSTFRDDFCGINSRSQQDLDSLYLLCKEGWIKSVLGEYQTRKQALNRFFLGAMILSDPVLEVIRRELRRVTPDVRIDVEEIANVLSTEVLKREVIDGDKAEEARKKIARAANKSLRAKAEAAVQPQSEPKPTVAQP
jgi:hypothetical protein